jgi:hypothetical protein
METQPCGLILTICPLCASRLCRGVIIANDPISCSLTLVKKGIHTQKNINITNVDLLQSTPGSGGGTGGVEFWDLCVWRKMSGMRGVCVFCVCVYVSECVGW